MAANPLPSQSLHLAFFSSPLCPCTLTYNVLRVVSSSAVHCSFFACSLHLRVVPFASVLVHPSLLALDTPYHLSLPGVPSASPPMGHGSLFILAIGAATSGHIGECSAVGGGRL